MPLGRFILETRGKRTKVIYVKIEKLKPKILSRIEGVNLDRNRQSYLAAQ